MPSIRTPEVPLLWSRTCCLEWSCPWDPDDSHYAGVLKGLEDLASPRPLSTMNEIAWIVWVLFLFVNFCSFIFVSSCCCFPKHQATALQPIVLIQSGLPEKICQPCLPATHPHTPILWDIADMDQTAGLHGGNILLTEISKPPVCRYFGNSSKAQF